MKLNNVIIFGVLLLSGLSSFYLLNSENNNKMTQCQLGLNDVDALSSKISDLEINQRSIEQNITPGANQTVKSSDIIEYNKDSLTIIEELKYNLENKLKGCSS